MGAGLAQRAAGTSTPEWKGTYTYGDDPVDYMYIKQGIGIYQELIKAGVEMIELDKDEIHSNKEPFKRKIDLKLYIRQYISSISNIHNSIRDILADDVKQQWENEINNAYYI